LARRFGSANPDMMYFDGWQSLEQLRKPRNVAGGEPCPED